MAQNKSFRYLWELALKGDNQALTKILKMFQPLLYQNSIINGKFNEECFQELNIKLIECIRKFRFNDEKNLNTYLNKTDNSE